MTRSPPLTLFGLASCDSCRNARKWLDTRSLACEIHDLRNDGLNIQMLERWSSRVDWKELLNTRSLTWRRLPEVDRNGTTKDRALSLMLEHPTLVKRPVLEGPDFVAVGFSPDRYQALFARD